jgi:hypothetical protein
MTRAGLVEVLKFSEINRKCTCTIWAKTRAVARAARGPDLTYFLKCNLSARIWSYLRINWGIDSSLEILEYAKGILKILTLLRLSFWLSRVFEMIGYLRVLNQLSEIGR